MLVFSLSLGGCSLAASGRNWIAIVGDSITYDSESAIASALGSNYSYLEVEGSPGYRINQMLSTMRIVADERPPPQAWVFNLGTNDALQNYQGWKKSFETALDLMSAAPCVVLVTVNTNADGYFGFGGDSVARAENALIEHLAGADPSHYRYINWDGLVAAHRSWLQSDRIHPDATGQMELAAWYKLALSTCP